MKQKFILLMFISLRGLSVQTIVDGDRLVVEEANNSWEQQENPNNLWDTIVLWVYQLIASIAAWFISLQ
ncbi:MAG: hypothetical protein V7459_00130 [Oceanicoccus sp.]